MDSAEAEKFVGAKDFPSKKTPSKDASMTLFTVQDYSFDSSHVLNP
jgi:hypothetical protein